MCFFWMRGLILFEDEGEDKGKGECIYINEGKGKPILVDVEDANIISNAKEDNRHFTPSHNILASQE